MNVGFPPPTDRTLHQTRSVRLTVAHWRLSAGTFQFHFRDNIMQIGVLFIRLTEQEKEESGEFHSIQRFSSDVAAEGEFGYEHIHAIIQVIQTQQITCLPQLKWWFIFFTFFLSRRKLPHSHGGGSQPCWYQLRRNPQHPSVSRAPSWTVLNESWLCCLGTSKDN